VLNVWAGRFCGVNRSTFNSSRHGSPESEGLERVSRMDVGGECNSAPEVPIGGTHIARRVCRATPLQNGTSDRCQALRRYVARDAE
jgi:hypothetical protein